MRCLKCDYPLAEVAEDRCPECGKRFWRDMPSTYRTKPKSSLIIRIGIIFWCLVILLFGSCYLLWFLQELFFM